MNESRDILKIAEKQYEQVVDDLGAISSHLHAFNLGVRKMSDPNSEEYQSWVARVRGGAYGTAGGITVGMIVADILGCLGICSAVGTTIGWGSAVAGAESVIAE